jgi:hypothetical protein
MQNGRINPPSLDLACPQAKTELGKHDHRFMEWSVDKQNTDKKHHTYQVTSHNRQITWLAITKGNHNRDAQGKP